MKTGRNKANNNKETEPNRTHRENGRNNGARSRKKQQEAEIVPSKRKAVKTNNAPSKRRGETSDRRQEKSDRI